MCGLIERRWFDNLEHSLLGQAQGKSEYWAGPY